MKGKFRNLVGQKFGYLTVLERAENDKCGNRRWLCKCDCGCEVVVEGGNLKRGRQKSCGCMHDELIARRATTHGMSKSKLYSLWNAMKTRCLNPNSQKYKDYGGRGISVYPAWINDFQAFYEYVSQLEHFGEKGYTLDREDNNGNYEPGNLRWADAKTQRHNRRDALIMVEYNGEEMCLKDAAQASGIPYKTLWMRYQRDDYERGRLFRPVGSK